MCVDIHTKKYPYPVKIKHTPNSRLRIHLTRGDWAFQTMEIKLKWRDTLELCSMKLEVFCFFLTSWHSSKNGDHRIYHFIETQLWVDQNTINNSASIIGIDLASRESWVLATSSPRSNFSLPSAALSAPWEQELTLILSNSEQRLENWVLLLIFPILKLEYYLCVTDFFGILPNL